MSPENQPQGRKVLTLLVELRCNSYCVFCGQREVDEPLIRTRRRLGLSVPQTTFGATRGRYTLETASEALRKARGEGFTELSLQGGEPTIWPDLVPLVAEARRLGFNFIGVVTNGRKLKDKVFTEALIEAGLDGISASLLGADAATHDAISAAPGSFDALIEGLRNASASARQKGRSVKINANVITTARSVGALPDQVRLLASAGVSAASVHLVRFSGLASDPAVKSDLRFDIRRITGALREGMAEAARLGIALHATDVPMCLHPRLAADELALLLRRRGIKEHHFQAAAFDYEVDPDRPHARPSACEGCLLDSACHRVPPEYLPDSPSDALRPLTVNSVDLFVEEALAAIDPAKAGAAEALREIERAVELLSALSERAPAGSLGRALARVREAIGDLLVLSIARRDFPEAMAAFCARLGIHPRIEWRAEGRAWSYLTMPIVDLAARAGAVRPSEAPLSPFRMRVGGGGGDALAVALSGSEGPDGELVIDAVRPVLSEARTTPERAALAVFLLVFCEPLRKAKRVRLAGDTLEVDAGGGFRPVWGLSRPGAIVIEKTA